MKAKLIELIDKALPRILAPAWVDSPPAEIFSDDLATEILEMITKHHEMPVTEIKVAANQLCTGWEFDECQSGALMWYYLGYTICATPYWEGSEGIEITISDTNDNTFECYAIPFFQNNWLSVTFKDTSDARWNHYVEVMQAELPNIEKRIIKHLNRKVDKL
jgi:hypothetical protein